MSHDHHDAPPNPPLAVVAVVSDATGRVLMGRRGPEVAAPGRWSLPGGFVSVGEEPTSALAREVAEETGLEVVDARIVDAALNASDPAKPVVVLTYAVSAEGTPRPADDFVEVGWFDLDALPPLAFDIDRERILHSGSGGTSQPGPGGS
jgi:8-oxo-dGTP diphosphatase